MPIRLNVQAYVSRLIAPETVPEDTNQPEREWREPPGMLGAYVRRVKKMTQAHAAAILPASRHDDGSRDDQ